MGKKKGGSKKRNGAGGPQDVASGAEGTAPPPPVPATNATAAAASVERARVAAKEAQDAVFTVFNADDAPAARQGGPSYIAAADEPSFSGPVHTVCLGHGRTPTRRSGSRICVR